MLFPTRLRRHFLTLTLCLACTAGAAAQKQSAPVRYTVQPGETLYRIAHNHGVTVQQIVAANPGLVAEKIQSGQAINLPAQNTAATVSASAAPTATTPAATSSSPKSEQPAAAPSYAKAYAKQSASKSVNDKKPKVTQYKVKRKDTPYSVAKSFGLTVEQLYDANPEMRAEGYKLKKGATLLIPDSAALKVPEGLASVRVSVVLPFAGDGVENVRSVEFYRGLLMGIERLKAEGLNVYLTAHAEPAPDEAVAQLTQKIAAEKPDVVIGGVYPTHFADISALSSDRTKVVIPFSSKVKQVESRPEVYLLNTPAAMQEALECDLFLASFKIGTRVLILQSGGTERTSFNRMLTDRLTAARYSVVRLSASSSPESLRLNLGANAKGRIVVVSDATTEKDAATAVAQVKKLRAMLPSAQISLAAPTCWLPFAAGAMKKDIHEADTYILAPSYFYPHTTAGREFADSYRGWFGGELLECTPRMAPLGYDLAVSLLGGMKEHGHNFNTQPAAGAAKVLQSNIGFVKAAPGGGYVNRSMWLVHFKPDMSIVKLSAK